MNTEIFVKLWYIFKKHFGHGHFFVNNSGSPEKFCLLPLGMWKLADRGGKLTLLSLLRGRAGVGNLGFTLLTVDHFVFTEFSEVDSLFVPLLL